MHTQACLECVNLQGWHTTLALSWEGSLQTLRQAREGGSRQDTDRQGLSGMLLTTPDVADPIVEDVMSRDLVYFVLPKRRWGLDLVI